MASHGEPELVELAFNDVVEEVMLFLGPELRGQAVQATLELGPDLPVARGDRVQLQQVFANLAVNALQAMEASEKAACSSGQRSQTCTQSPPWLRTTAPEYLRTSFIAYSRASLPPRKAAWHRTRHLPIDRGSPRRRIGSCQSVRRPWGAVSLHDARRIVDTSPFGGACNRVVHSFQYELIVTKRSA
jgi:hypothetical protein